jgi:uncharacterized membrane protein
MEIGFLLILLGIFLIIVGTLIFLFKFKSKNEFAVSIFIGPLPIIVGTEKAIIISILIIISMILIILLIR